MKMFLAGIRILFLIITLPAVSLAWNSQGHRTAGAIVYYSLKANNRDVINKILQTLTYHPWYNTMWAAGIKNLTGDKREVELFMLASTFPDDARGTDLGSDEKTMWHYIDYPFVPDEYKPTVKGVPPQIPNAQQRILELLEALRTEPDGRQKALDICWLLHLIEDVHQPLHCTSMFDYNNPQGDKGGNLIFIKIGLTDEQNLHHYWDAAPVEDNVNCADKAWDLLMKFPKSKLDELKNKDVVSWIKDESYQLAVKDAYLDGRVNGTQNAPTRILGDYEKRTKEICERRVVLSGIRLAEKLVDIYSTTGETPK